MKLKKLDMRGFSHEVAMVLFVVIFAIIGVGYLVSSHANSLPPAQFSVSPLSQAETVGNTFTVAINLNTNGNNVSYVRAFLTYPSNLLGCTLITTTTAFNFNAIPPSCSGGNIKLIGSKTAASTTNPQIATVTFTSLSAGNAYVAFNPTTTLVGNQATTVPFPSMVTNGTFTITAPTPTNIGEQLSIPPQRRPAQYVHVCITGNTTYVTQGTPNCLSGGTFLYDYPSTVPGTTYNVPCGTTGVSTSSLIQLVYISSTETCPAGTSN